MPPHESSYSRRNRRNRCGLFFVVRGCVRSESIAGDLAPDGRIGESFIESRQRNGISLDHGNLLLTEYSQVSVCRRRKLLPETRTLTAVFRCQSYLPNLGCCSRGTALSA